MEIFFYIVLFIFWSLFWSFASVIIYRLKSGEAWIMWWRSHCAKCNHILWALELIPIFSWLKNFWKCKYCKKKISAIYPFLEISTGILFTLIWYFLIDLNLLISGDWNEIIKLWFWLVIWLITIIYSFYDILFLEIHDGVMLFWIVFTILFLILEVFWIINIFPYFFDNPNILENIIWLTILITSILLYYIIIFKELELKYDFLILFIIWLLNFLFINNFWVDTSNLFINAWIWIIIIFTFLFLQIAVSNWAWMWWGDLRIAILMWLLLWFSYSVEWLFLTYIFWSIISIFIVILSKFKNWFNTTFNSQVPFGPFLALWTFTIIFWQKSLTEIINLYL